MAKAGLLEELAQTPQERRAERLRAAGNPDELLIALGDEAEQLNVVEVARALRASELVTRLADEVGGAKARVRARRAQIQSLAYAGRFEEALAVAREALDIGQSHDEQIETARVRVASMHALGEMGRYDEAIAEGEAAYRVFAALGERELGARADINLGVIHQNRDEPQKALRHFQRAREALPPDAGQLPFFIENNTGEALWSLQDFSGAEAAFSRALQLAEKLDAPFAIALAEGNLADLAARRGLLHSALYHYERARRCFERDAAGSHLARLLAEEAEVLEQLGLFDEAVRRYDESLPRLEQFGQLAEQARALTGKGRCLSRMGRSADADVALSEAAHLYEELSQRRHAAHVLLIRAELALVGGRISEARSLVRSAGEALHERDLDRAILGVVAARIALAADDLETAAAELDAAEAALARVRLPAVRSEVLHSRAELLRRQRRLAEARDAALEAVSELERLRGALQAERCRTAFLSNYLSVYEDAVLLTLAAGGNRAEDAAFEMIEHARGRALLDLAVGALEREPQADSGADEGDAQLARRIREHQANLSALHNQAAEAALRARRDALADTLRLRILEEERSLDELERRVASARGPVGLYARAASADEARGSLAPNEALVEYFLARGELLAVVVRSGETRVFRELLRREDLLESTRRVRFQISRAMRPGTTRRSEARMLDDAQRELAALYGAIWRPLAAALEGVAHVTVAPHSCLHVVPFHALFDGRQYLCDRFEMAVTPSASLLARLRARDGASVGDEATAVVLGAADELAPSIDAEARAVGRLLGAQQTYIGDDATVANLERAAASADVIHLACHGHFDPSNPSQSGLRLADRWLTPRDIYRLRLNDSLVVLSGCDTGRVTVRAGDELIGLLRGFLASGAATVVCSLWPLHDEGGTLLMQTFYNELRAGDRRVAAAMRRAQQQVRDRRPHPAFWAPHIVLGRS
ncbi:MAG: CHAT domain-containing protein [Planctomycetota bacterium]|nr:MAG: CHAT domain-containing protein [Planctomycetota bacterium]